jgi:hypothetical protein
MPYRSIDVLLLWGEALDCATTRLFTPRPLQRRTDRELAEPYLL